MKRMLVAFLLLVTVAACQNAKPTGTPASISPAPPATVMILPTLTPVPLTDPALTDLKKEVKAAFDAQDIDKLRDTISFSRWVASIYREGGTMPIDPPRGLNLSLQFAKENNLEIDAERPTYEPNWSINEADTAVFVLVKPKDGSAPYYAHLLITHEAGGWRYTGIVTRIPYYDAPTIAQVRAKPTQYEGKEYMYVGTYQGQDNPPSAAGAAPSEQAFIIDTFAGPIWATLSDAPYVFPFPADADSKKGQLVRVFGKIMLKDGAPYLETDSVEFIAPTEYAHTQGVIEKIDANARQVTLKPTNNGIANLHLSELSFVSLPDGARGDFSDLKAGETVDAIGAPQSEGTLLVEELFISK